MYLEKAEKFAAITGKIIVVMTCVVSTVNALAELIDMFIKDED